MITVDGVTYRWNLEEDPNAGSLDFSHRGVNVETINITGDDGSSIRFIHPSVHLDFRGWWWRGREFILTDEVIERAIRIATRDASTSQHFLDEDAVIEAFHGPRRTLEEELDRASAAIAVLARGDAPESGRAWADSVLAIVLSKGSLDEWVVANALPLRAARRRLEGLLEETGTHLLFNRSALAFVIESCERMKIELGVDTSKVDAALPRTYRKQAPWGIPQSHWWWSAYVFYRDPYEDND